MPDWGMWNMNIEFFSFEKAFNICSGHRDEWHPECNEDYPDHMVPVNGFGKDSSSKDGLHHRCLKCDRMRVADEQRHPITNEWKRNWKHRIAKQLGGTQGTPGWKENLDEAQSRWNVDMKNHLLNTAPAKEYFDWIDSQKKSVVKQRVVSIKSRNSTQYTKLKELYNYTCQVESCYETEVQFAHILKHSLPNSVDNHTNGWCICCNHHNAYDSNRMIVEVNGDFVRYNVHGDKVEEGRIIYHDRHEVDPQFIILAREWHDDTKKQALG